MNGQRILVVDDEPQILRALQTTLRGAGYTVDSAATAGEALTSAAAHPPEAVILDLVLPDGNGTDVCRELRTWSDAPVIVLSAVGEEREKIAALDAGADDYVTKPFSVDELLARLRAVLRRRSPSQEPVIEVGELRIDVAERVVTVEGKRVKLSPHEFDLLRVLAQNRGKLLTHRTLLREVWGPAYQVEAHYLHVYVSHLRRKIEPDPSSPRYLLTEPGAGYRLVDPSPSARLGQLLGRPPPLSASVDRPPSYASPHGLGAARPRRPAATSRASAPWLPAVACVAASAAVFGLGVAGGLSGDALLVTPLSLALLGLVLAVRRWEERHRACAAADAWIARGYESRALAVRLADRGADVAARAQDARPLRPRHRPRARCRAPARRSPLNRFALRPFRAELIALADRLDDLERPVSAAGILGVHRLLTESGSVLYRGPRSTIGRVTSAPSSAQSSTAWRYAADVRPCCDRDRDRVLRVRLRDALRAGPDLMSAADAFGLAVSLAVFVYLVYALFRGERF